MIRTPEFWLDVLVEYIWNGANFMLGVMVAQGTITMPSKAAVTVGMLTGLVGAANHIRALRKVAT